ncbi:MAG TPA: hypothetical protein VFQ44_11905 [Streptosporangiaceae bacterium]|nr:hypothetical protein [Streptosporangiaceae bacterium]
MQVRVRFRYRADTGEVELFEVDDLHSGPRLADHDARHDRAAADVARIIERNALIEEVAADVEIAEEVTIQRADESREERQEQRREQQADG